MEKVEKGNISRTAHRLSVKLNFLSAFLFPTTPPRLFLPIIPSSFSSFDAFPTLMHMYRILSALWNLVEITFMYLQKNGCFHHTQVQSNVYSCPSLLKSCSVNFIIVTLAYRDIVYYLYWHLMTKAPQPSLPNQTYQSNPILHNHAYQTNFAKPTKKNYLSKSSQTSLPNQIYSTKRNNRSYQSKHPDQTSKTNLVSPMYQT